MALGTTTRSAAPVLIALCGILGNSAVRGVCTMLRPPAALMALSPTVPSWSVPLSTMPTLHSCMVSASDAMKKSMGLGAGGLICGSASKKMQPPRKPIILSGGIT
jgi:hypothetical protein